MQKTQKVAKKLWNPQREYNSANAKYGYGHPQERKAFIKLLTQTKEVRKKRMLALTRDLHKATPEQREAMLEEIGHLIEIAKAYNKLIDATTKRLGN